jgi:membrane protease YdiL (CAAX protease family)
MVVSARERWKEPALAAFALVPFFVNDLAYMVAETPPQWLGADYASKAAMLVVACSLPAFRAYIRASLRPKRGWAETWILALLALAAILLSEYWVREPLDQALPGTRLYVFPDIDSRPLYWFDMTFGLLLTALAEEIVNRGVARRIIESFAGGAVAVALLSSLVFALGHWSAGVGTVTSAFVSGIVLMALFLRTGSLVPGIAVHYAANAVTFA